MSDMLFTIGATISAAMPGYGAYLAIRYALLHEHVTPATADELTEIGYYLSS